MVTGLGPLVRGVVALVVASLASGCGATTLGGGPSENDYAQLVLIRATVPACRAQTGDGDACRELVDVRVTDTSPAGGNWTRVQGTATVAQDLYDRVPVSEAATACGVGPDVEPDTVDERLGPDVLLLERTVTAGTPAEFDYEMVVEEAGDDVDEDEITDGGWTEVASGGGFTAAGADSGARGFPAAFYEGFDAAVVVGTPEFDDLCAAGPDPRASTAPSGP